MADEDYLEVDKPLPGQNYVCMSFISPENTYKQKELFYFNKFMNQRCGEYEQSIDKIIVEIMSTGPMAISEAKKLTLIFDRWKGDDLQLRQYTLDKTSEMRGSKEGQEGLSSFLERRNPDWKDEI